MAGEVAADARAVASILAATPLAALKSAYPERPVYRFIPSLPVEVRQGAVVQAADPAAARIAPSIESVRDLFSELGTLVTLDDGLLDVAMGLMSCAPAYVALVAEAQIDAGVQAGHPRRAGGGARRADARPAPRSCCARATSTRSPSAARSPRRAASPRAV